MLCVQCNEHVFLHTGETVTLCHGLRTGLVAMASEVAEGGPPHERNPSPQLVAMLAAASRTADVPAQVRHIAKRRILMARMRPATTDASPSGR